MILTAKNIAKEPTTLTILYETKDGGGASTHYIAVDSEIKVVLPDNITSLNAFSEFPDSIIISGFI